MAELSSKLDEEKKQWELPDEFTYMEELAQQLSSYTLSEPQNEQTQTQTPPQVKQNRILNHHGNGVVHSVYAFDHGDYRVMPPVPGYQFPLTGILQKQQNQSGVGRNCFLPFQATNVGVGVGAGVGSGFVKGTGVFLPRVDPIEATRKRQSGDENYYSKVPVKRNLKKNSVGKKEGVGMKTTAELGLPQEWTY